MKKLIGAVLALFLVLGALLPVYADDGDKVYRTFMYNDRKSEYVNFEVEFVFNDSWFGLPATEYNHSLAKALAVLCGAAYVDVERIISYPPLLIWGLTAKA